MRVAPFLFVATLAACPNNVPNLPGVFLGSFSFQGQMVFGDGGTTCLVDGGVLLFPSTVQFYAQLSLLDGGTVDWQLQNAIPVQGTLTGGTVEAVTTTEAIVAGCNCVGILTETVTLFADGGLAPGLSQLNGSVDDRLDANDQLDGGACFSDAGLGCGLGCDLIYSISGVPAEPSGGY